MSTSEGDILRHLATVTAPIDVRELARALGTDGIPRLNYELGNLVRKRFVKRHHCGDGVLRYTLPEGPVRSGAKAYAVHPAALSTSGKNKPGVSASAVLKVMSATVAMTKNQIAALVDLTDMQVMGAIQSLRRAGKIIKHGNFTDATWTLAPVLAAAAPAAAGTKPAPDATDTADALEHAVEMAEAALDAYIQSKVEQDVYTLLVRSAKAARAARDQFQAGHHV